MTTDDTQRDTAEATPRPMTADELAAFWDRIERRVSPLDYSTRTPVMRQLRATLEQAQRERDALRAVRDAVLTLRAPMLEDLFDQECAYCGGACPKSQPFVHHDDCPYRVVRALAEAAGGQAG